VPAAARVSRQGSGRPPHRKAAGTRAALGDPPWPTYIVRASVLHWRVHTRARMRWGTCTRAHIHTHARRARRAGRDLPKVCARHRLNVRQLAHEVGDLRRLRSSTQHDTWHTTCGPAHDTWHTTCGPAHNTTPGIQRAVQHTTPGIQRAVQHRRTHARLAADGARACKLRHAHSCAHARSRIVVFAFGAYTWQRHAAACMPNWECGWVGECLSGNDGAGQRPSAARASRCSAAA
jgi:hypothetical protein